MSDKPVQVSGTLYWPSLKRPSQLSGKYQFELGNLSDAAVEALGQMGLSVLNRDDKPEKGSYITVKSTTPMRAYDTDSQEIHAEVGNGSKAVAVIRPYSWEFGGKKGRSPSLMKLVVTDLEVYESVEEVDVDLENAL